MQAGKIIFEGVTAKGLHVVLRHPRHGDAPALLDFINTLSREQTYILFQGEQLTLKDEESYLESRLAVIAAGTGVQLLAFADGQLAGNAGIDRKWGTNRHTGELGISVAHAFRGQGVGELLMKVILDEANRQIQELEIVTLEVFGNNPVAINLYQKVGFIEFGRLPGGRLHRGEYVDNIYMYRRLRDV
jgi:RimJ/RimL family protein N-acetyltransferase